MKNKNNTNKHNYFMSLALKEAKKGFGNTMPNPLVGALIVKDGQILAKSYHKEFGKNHAEINALDKLNHQAKDSSMYVTLEPCSHHGNTPPCVDSIIKAGVKEVIIPFKDPSKKVCGKGIEKLKANNIKVVSSVLVEDTFNINEEFLYHSITQKPLVTVKYASSIDGKLSPSNNQRMQLTNELSNKQVQILRAKNHGILIGSNTLNVDNPLLSIRIENCTRINQKFIVGNANNIDTNLKIFQQKNNVNIISNEKLSEEKIADFKAKNINIIDINSQKTIKASDIVQKLGESGITSVLVEGGSFVISSFFSCNVVDKIDCFISPLILGGDVNITSFKVNNLKNQNQFLLKNLTNYDNDIHISYESKAYNKWKKETIKCLQE